MDKGQEFIQLKSICLFIMLTNVFGLFGQTTDFKNIDFTLADSIAFANSNQNLSNLPILAYQLTATLETEVEKFRSIYTWVCTNISYDYSAYVNNRKNRERLYHDSVALATWNYQFSQIVFKKLLREQKTVCTGYAYLVKELTEMAGIHCKIIDGFGRTSQSNLKQILIPNHSWNVVLLNDSWYLCDPTWSSGGMNILERHFLPEYNDGYFLTEPELFAKNHFPLDTTWFLTNSRPNLEDFINGPIIYKDAFKFQIQPIQPEKLEIISSKKDSFEIILKVNDPELAKKIYLEFRQGSSSQLVIPEIVITNNGLVEIHCVLTRCGKYDVHVMLDTKYLLTYKVVVKKSIG